MNNILSVKQRFGIIGNNILIENAIDVALRVAPTDLSVLITGESGVGKEVFPQIIHAFSSRKHKNYIAVNCGAIPDGTIDSELFGHEKGSFTGATDSRKGYFEMADGGTIFLDEVAELPQTTQVRLLRILQTGDFMKVGSSKVQKTNVRVIAATNINLTAAISKGNFREDLYYRLNTVPIILPPLRERKEDINILFRRFCIDIATQYSMPNIFLAEEAKKMLENYSWPGNIRQLKNVAEQISVIETKRDIDGATLYKYLPIENREHSEISKGNYFENSTTNGNSDRELLFTVLYDMRKDIIDLKKMVSALSSQNPQAANESKKTTPHALLNPAPMQLALPASEETNYPVNRYSEDIEVIETTDFQTKEDYHKDSIIKALEKHKGKRKEAAKELFISERTLYRRIKELGIDE